MTLLDKLTYFFKPGLALLLIPFFFACDNPDDLGLELDQDENPFTLRDTTITIPATTIYIDSLRTDQYNFLTVGTYQDSIYGEVKAISYNEYIKKGGTLPGDSLAFESAHIILEMYTARSKEPLINQQLNIFEAEDTIFSQAVYLSDFSLSYDESKPISTYTLDFNPKNDSTINIPLSDDFGLSLFEKLKSATTKDDLEKLDFKPLVFAPGEDNEALLSFDLAPDTVGIYVTMSNAFSGKTYFYIFDFRTAHFVEVQRDISSSEKLSGLDSDFDSISVPSSRAYLDPLAGIYTKLDLRPLVNFLNQDADLLINLAQLTIPVITNTTVFGVQPANPVLQFYFVKENPGGSNSINGPAIAVAKGLPASFQAYWLAASNGVLSESAYLSQAPDLLELGYNKTDLNYQATTTMFTQLLADYASTDNNSLVEELVIVSWDPPLRPGDDPTSFSLGQLSFPSSEIKMKIYYTTVNQ